MVLIFTADIDFLGSEWLLIASVLFVVALGFSVLVMTPNAKSMIEIMRSMPPGPPPAGGTGPPPELQRLIKRSQIGGMFLSVLFLAILVLMVWKPGAAFI